ncbi:MAG: hypothetical protein FJ225_12140 [Lentisphaerae bacterium]|nr:hypothetical protein [Lentisphaerota bacterium]
MKSNKWTRAAVPAALAGLLLTAAGCNEEEMNRLSKRLNKAARESDSDTRKASREASDAIDDALRDFNDSLKKK